MAKATYKASGADLDAHRHAMARLPRLLRRTHSPRVLDAEGGFAGLFALDFSGDLFARKYQDPILVSSTDGVGTKLKIAQRMNRYDTIGMDLVAICANNTLCMGAEPLFFLDYVAMARDDPALLEQIVQGISDGCLEADLALIGGETAILPDVYQPGDYDLAGFCVGVVERKRIIDGSSIVPHDVILGIASNGLHSTGYSLARRIVFEMSHLDVTDTIPSCGTSVGELLLRPTQIYVRAVRNVLGHYRIKGVVHGMAPITGGGLHENLERVLPEGIQARIDRGSWVIPPVFPWLQQLGKVEDDAMDRVFNMGVGLVLVVSPYYAESIMGQLIDSGHTAWIIGQVTEGPRGVQWD
ncbi:MAG: phosphoribosylformylglycinamidine cyclo-ligase [Pirellulales bacterium]|nr:phosphoribosylformylglycinamidine cyclo-ligase [Pirellulales bacterium]